MGRTLENNDKAKQQPGLGEQRAAQKEDEIGHIHGVAGQPVKAILVDAAFRRGRKIDDGHSEQDKARGIDGCAGVKQRCRSRLDFQKEQVKKNGGVRGLVNPIGGFFLACERRKIGGPGHSAFTQQGQKPKPNKEKGEQQ